MDDNTLNKFADLFAQTVATGDARDLQKEASACALTKEALDATSFLLPAGSAAAGGIAGYLSTDDKKRKLRNAMYGALTGGAAGLGGQLLWHGLNGIAGGKTTGGGQMSIAPEKSPAAARPAKEEAAAAAAGQHIRTDPNSLPNGVLPESADDPRSPLKTPRYAFDAIAGAYGASRANQLVSGLSKRLGLSGYSDLKKLDPKAFGGVADLLDTARRNPTAATSTYLKSPAARPPVFTDAAPVRPQPPVSRVGLSAKGNPSRSAAVPVDDYLKAVGQHDSNLNDWTARRAASQAARAKYREDFQRYRGEQPAKQQLAQQILRGKLDATTPQKQIASENVLAEMLEKLTGKRLNKTKLRELSGGVNSAKVNRSTASRAGVGLVGGLGAATAADAAGSVLQNQVAEYLQNQAKPGSSTVIPYSDDRVSQLVRFLGLER